MSRLITLLKNAPNRIEVYSLIASLMVIGSVVVIGIAGRIDSKVESRIDDSLGVLVERLDKAVKRQEEIADRLENAKISQINNQEIHLQGEDQWRREAAKQILVDQGLVKQIGTRP